MYLALYYYCMKNNPFRQSISGSSYSLPAHGWCGARARKNNATKKFASPSEGAAEGGMWGEFRRARAKNRGQPRRLLVQSRAEQNTLFLN